MITLSNNKKTIQLSNTVSCENINEENYTLKLPIIVCSDKVDAEYIQQQVNTFIVNLTRKLMRE